MAVSWPAQLVQALEHFFFRVIGLVLEGNVGDVRFWLFYFMALSMIWAAAWVLVTKIKNGSK